MMTIHFIRRLKDGSTYRLGTAARSENGWRFISNVASHHSSRKFHLTWKKSLPRWVGYPDHCEIDIVDTE